MATRGLKVLVLGEMGELGDGSSVKCHQDLGQDLATREFDQLITVGGGAAHLNLAARNGGFPAGRLRHFENTAEAAQAMAGLVQQDDTLFLKGSRTNALERIAEALCAQFGEATQP